MGIWASALSEFRSEPSKPEPGGYSMSAGGHEEREPEAQIERCQPQAERN